METLFTITVLELFLGGGGRLTEVGPLTLRMILFGACVSFGAIALLMKPRQDGTVRLAFGLLAAYLLVHLPGLVGAALNGGSTEDMIGEAQQSLYWAAAPFFAMMLRTERMVEHTARLVQIAGLTLASVYLLGILAILLGVVDFASVLAVLAESGEFASRGGGFFFYKGFLYLGIATIFLIAIRPKWWRIGVILVGTALVATLTRGFILSTSVAVLLMLALQGRKVTLGFGLAAVLLAGLIMWVYLPSFDDSVLRQRAASNLQRVDDMVFIVDRLSLRTVLLGEGFGSLINGRVLIENTYLWALWKLGVVGVLFWMTPLLLCTYFFISIPNFRRDGLACAFYFGAILLYVQTGTNPYLNNPIGLSYMMIAIFSLRTLAQVRSVAAAASETELPLLPAGARS